MANEDSIDDYTAARLAEHYARVRLRESKKAAKRTRWQKVIEERQQADEERARLRELRNQPCGAKTRAGHPCRRIGRGGHCRNHGGASTGPKTEAGRQRMIEAPRKRWQALRSQLGRES
jgi:hypothetical protein